MGFQILQKFRFPSPARRKARSDDLVFSISMRDLESRGLVYTSYTQNTIPKVHIQSTDGLLFPNGFQPKTDLNVSHRENIQVCLFIMNIMNHECNKS